MNASWFSIKKEKEELGFETELYKKIEDLSLENKELSSKVSSNVETMSSMSSTIDNMSSTIDNMSSTIDNMSSTIDNMSSTIDNMSSTIEDLKQKFSIIEVENLKLINRILEAEISLERTKNILVRKNISFPFIATPLSSRFL
jgi:methyl-accepting chemotaxis protein